ncbi:unnamed protein product [Hymenolepis diminuta]|uniref:Parvovirus non-structural protein 1 helicase domain-containing protein n=1 Tax=Hymenolepis diminuta TaxID=6216 RepID=A0A564YTK2_HYMDI|nr:unnamed protein product [Hymenolepis diminuta]
MLIPPEIIEECSSPTTLRRMNMNKEQALRTRNKFEREKSLFDLFKSLTIQSEEEFNEWLKMDPNQLPEIWAKYGQNWRIKLREYIEICVKTKRGRFHKPFYEITYLDMVFKTECPDTMHDPNPIEGARHFYAIFKENDINITEFLFNVNSIICMHHSRMNALVLRGPTTTGKSLIAKNIVSLDSARGRGGDAKHWLANPSSEIPENDQHKPNLVASRPQTIRCSNPNSSRWFARRAEMLRHVRQDHGAAQKDQTRESLTKLPTCRLP